MRPRAKPENDEKKRVEQEVRSVLENSGFGEEVAKAKMEEWRKEGLNTTEQIKGKLVGNSLKQLAIRLGWLGTNAYLTYTVYLYSLGFEKDNSWLQWPTKFFTYLNAFSFAQELLLFGITAYATVQFARNPVLLEVLQDIAGKAELPTLEVKPQKVVDSIKVFTMLLELNTRLREMELDPSPLDTLSSMLTLQQNTDVDPDIPNLDEAAKIFNRYDINDDQRLDLEELRLLLKDAGLKLAEEEVDEAFKQLDSKNKDGYIQFGEFATFWANRLPRPQD